MKPVSDFTTPRTLICPMSRHFLPVEQPEPEFCCTTGLKNGSRLPFIAHFFCSGFGGAGASTFFKVAGFSAAGIFVVTAATGFEVTLEASTVVVVAFAAGPFASAAAFTPFGAGAGTVATATFGVVATTATLGL